MTPPNSNQQTISQNTKHQSAHWKHHSHLLATNYQSRFLVSYCSNAAYFSTKPDFSSFCLYSDFALHLDSWVSMTPGYWACYRSKLELCVLPLWIDLSTNHWNSCQIRHHLTTMAYFSSKSSQKKHLPIMTVAASTPQWHYPSPTSCGRFAKSCCSLIFSPQYYYRAGIVFCSPSLWMFHQLHAIRSSLGRSAFRLHCRLLRIHR